MNNRAIYPLLIGMLVTIITAGFIGKFTPMMTPDTSGYLVPMLWPDVLLGERTPFFAIIVNLLGGSKNNYALVPLANIILFFLSLVILFNAAIVYGVSSRAGLALTIPVLISNPVFLFLNLVQPEIISIAFMVMAVSSVLRICSKKDRRRDYVFFASSIGLSYLLKPAFVFFIPALPVMAFLLCRINGLFSCIESGRKALIVLLLSSFFFLGFSTLRLSAVDDFNVVSFGGFASSGLSGLMLTPEIADSLPERHQDLARTIIEQRDRLAFQGEMLPIPYNSERQRSFLSTALGYFDVLARSYDNVVFDIVGHQRQLGESWVEFNARLQDFFIEVIKADPVKYAAWVIGASTRIAGRLIVTNASFMLCSFSLVSLYLFSLICSKRRFQIPFTRQPLDWPTILIVVGVYTLANWLPMTLVTFPARRYVDTGGLFVASIPFFAFIQLWLSVNRRSIGGGSD